MVHKAAVAGIELVAAVSAPTSLAVEVAQRTGVTLVWFVRGPRYTIYANGQRVRELQPA
jgi:FdhD protein